MTGLVGQLAEQMPVALEDVVVAGRTGLVIVDEVNGFATVGAGNLAPATPNEQVSRMVAETDSLAHAFLDRGLPVLAFLDTHEPGKPEPPYPPHCERGTGEEELVPELAWLAEAPGVTLVRKDCINGFVGAIDLDSGANRIVDWVNEHGLETVLVVGICTDICVMDFVLTFLSARDLRFAARRRGGAWPARDGKPPAGPDPSHGALFHAVARRASGRQCQLVGRAMMQAMLRAHRDEQASWASCLVRPRWRAR
jgi:nicotinamidase-related amidase